MNRRVDPETLAKYFPEEQKALARSLTTADKIKPPPKPEFVVEKLKIPRFSPEKKHAFKLLAPYGFYILATDRPLSAHSFNPDDKYGMQAYESFGHNELAWPVRVGDTASWDDTVSTMWNRNPVAEQRVKWRLWTRRLEERQALLLAAGKVIREAAERAGYRPMYAGFVNMGPRFQALNFGKDMQILARRNSIFTWTDAALSEFLDRALEVAKLKGIYIVGQRGQKMMSPAFERLVDAMADKEARKQIVAQQEPDVE